MSESSTLFPDYVSSADITNHTTPPPHRADVWLSNRPEAVIVPVIFAIIFLVGVLGNGTLVFIVTRHKKLRNAPNILIVSLALGDLVLLFVSVPFAATIYTFNDWPYGELMCRLNSFLQCFSVGVSVFTLIALSADRHAAIVHPMQRHRNSSITRALSIAVTLWVVSALLSIPEAIASRIERHHITNSTYLDVCVEHPYSWGSTYPKYIVTFKFVVYFAVPLLIIGVFYLLMAHMLVLSSRHMPGEAGKSSAQFQKQTEARQKVARLVLSFVVIFMMCWLPRYIYLLWYYFDPGAYNMFWHVFKITGFCLCFINSCVNPMALYFLSRQFRSYYNHTLFCLCSRGHTRRRPSDAEQSHFYNGDGRSTSVTMSMLPSQIINCRDTSTNQCYRN